MLEQAGWVDSRWYTLSSCERGSCVHRLTADLDLGAIADPSTVVSKYGGWLQAHADFNARVKPEILAGHQEWQKSNVVVSMRQQQQVMLEQQQKTKCYLVSDM